MGAINSNKRQKTTTTTATQQVKGEDAKLLIHKYLNEQRRPYGINDIVVNLRNKVNKPTAIKILDELVANGEIQCKLFGKANIYYCNKQENFNAATTTDRKSLIEKLKDEVNKLELEKLDMENDLKIWENIPYNTDADILLSQDIEKITEEIIMLKEKVDKKNDAIKLNRERFEMCNDNIIAVNEQKIKLLEEHDTFNKKLDDYSFKLEKNFHQLVTLLKDIINPKDMDEFLFDYNSDHEISILYSVINSLSDIPIIYYSYRLFLRGDESS
ncbi:Hop2p SCDLUD_001534 [Saccharomycodes ludwigii]|uniref:Hop2p n=1 Tax=Saccharomycodes ludwigii TaxID=36035 RepID=UPI001E83E83E|nr:hypothetical protein SCDLUD_001534 [Saccharomycodes ludwigii]KAH3901758.1 hypothetical protein SCDLUD_001534 [Saccharomycodes ludwigii]